MGAEATEVFVELAGEVLAFVHFKFPYFISPSAETPGRGAESAGARQSEFAKVSVMAKWN
jgi:hypothetical protein